MRVRAINLVEANDFTPDYAAEPADGTSDRARALCDGAAPGCWVPYMDPSGTTTINRISGTHIEVMGTLRQVKEFQMKRILAS